MPYISKIVALARKDGIRFQKIKQRTDQGDINEFVAFDEDSIKEMVPLPIDWKVFEKINTSTSHLYPSEVVRTERIYKMDFACNEILHLALQFKLKVGPLSFGHPEAWTTTCFFYPHETTKTESHNIQPL